ncbi:MAG: GDP-mannose 4,6-dehydratase, partial [Candidatus Omnitrophica bacterium]|nr:GDP-mannose 4,6-dehydratase [Candidatus Omnitrophota bacterium]
NGFLGTALREYFKTVQPSFTVFGIDRFKPLFPRRVFLCNLNDQKKISEIISSIRPDYVFHLAGGRANAEKDLLTNNVLATSAPVRGATGIRGYQPRIIIPGSAAEYGETVPAAKPVKETVPARPISFYGFAKKMQTDLGMMYARAGLNVMVARIFNVCGQGIPPTLSLGQFSRQIALIEKGKKKSVIQTRSFGIKRDFLDVKDVCSAFFTIARRGISGDIYNVCSGKSYLMRDLLEELIGYAKNNDIIIKENKRVMQDVDISIGSNVKIKRTTGWKPKVDISQSLKDTLSYYRKRVLKK